MLTVCPWTLWRNNLSPLPVEKYYHCLQYISPLIFLKRDTPSDFGLGTGCLSSNKYGNRNNLNISYLEKLCSARFSEKKIKIQFWIFFNSVLVSPAPKKATRWGRPRGQQDGLSLHATMTTAVRGLWIWAKLRPPLKLDWNRGLLSFDFLVRKSIEKIEDKILGCSLLPVPPTPSENRNLDCSGQKNALQKLSFRFLTAVTTYSHPPDCVSITAMICTSIVI